MKYSIAAIISFLFIISCSANIDVGENPLASQNSSTTNVSQNDISTFSGGASANTLVVGGCLDRNNIDVYTAGDVDKDGVADLAMLLYYKKKMVTSSMRVMVSILAIKYGDGKIYTLGSFLLLRQPLLFTTSM